MTSRGTRKWLQGFRATVVVCWAAAVVALLAAAFLGVGPLRQEGHGGLEVAGWVAGVVGVVLALAPVVRQGVVGAFRLGRRASTPQQVSEARGHLLQLSRGYIRGTIRRRGLADRPLPLRVAVRKNAAVKIAVTPDPADLAVTVKELVAVLGPEEAGRLVVLGGTGSGKSSLALLLGRALLDLATDDPERPVPVLLSLSAYRPDEHIADWIAGRVTHHFPPLRDRYGPDAVAQLVLTGRVLPIIDGVDDLAEDDRAALRESLAKRWNEDSAGFVITCRTKSHPNDGGNPLRAAPTVTVTTIDAGAALRYVAEHDPVHRPQWTDLATRVRGGHAETVRSVLTTPLMAHLALIAGQAAGGGPAGLLRFRKPADVENHLLDRYVPGAVSDWQLRQRELPRIELLPEKQDQLRGDSRLPLRWRPARADRYARTLAGTVPRKGLPEIRWWALKANYTSLPGLVVPAVAAAIVLVASWAARQVVAGDPGLIENDVKWAGVTALCVALARRSFVVLRPQAEIPVMFIIGTAAACGIATTLLLQPHWGLVLGIVAGLPAALAGAAVALTVAALIVTRDSILTLRRLVRRAKFFALLGAVTAATAFGLIAYVGPGDADGPLVAAWTVAGFLIFLRYSLWGAHVDARLVKAMQGTLPLRFVRFVEDMSTIGVLRDTSANCEFRHVRLARRLREDDNDVEEDD